MTIKPKLFEFFIWSMGKMLTVPIMIILELIFVLIDVARGLLDVAIFAFGVARVAWQVALAALSVVGITEASAAQRAVTLQVGLLHPVHHPGLSCIILSVAI